MHHDAARHQLVQRPRDRAVNGEMWERKLLTEHLAVDACNCPANVAKREAWKTLGQVGKLLSHCLYPGAQPHWVTQVAPTHGNYVGNRIPCETRAGHSSIQGSQEVPELLLHFKPCTTAAAHSSETKE